MFKDNIGGDVSAIYLTESKLLLSASRDVPNFVNNVTPYGTTIASLNSELGLKRMHFRGNSGFKGGVFLLDSSSVLKDEDSVYEANEANQGGVIYVINESEFEILRGSFVNNRAQEGAVVYAMYNEIERALKFSQCSF